MLDHIGKVLLGKIVGLPVETATAVANNFLANEKAFRLAKEHLRSKYENLVAPASYEGVTENFRLTNQDFVDYFKSSQAWTFEGMRDSLRNRLLNRSANWVNNRPAQDLFDSMINDFYDFYERYFVATDAGVSSATLHGMAREVIEHIITVRKELAELRAVAIPPDSRRTFDPEDITHFLICIGVPYDLLEQTADYTDINLVDPKGVFQTSIFASLHKNDITAESLDAISIRTRATRVSKRVVVLPRPPALSAQQAALARGIELFTSQDFRSLFVGLRTEDYRVGKMAFTLLAEQLNIESAYVDPDADTVLPINYDDRKLFSRSAKASALVDEFLSSSRDDILIVLGSYGSGKSALCAQTALRLLASKSDWTPVYIPLRQLSAADELEDRIAKAEAVVDQLRHGTKPLLVLDGLDEIPNAIQTDQKRMNILRLARSGSERSKIIITARTSYFRGLSDLWQLFGRSDVSTYWDKLATHISGTDRLRMVTAIILHEFTGSQIEDYVNQVSSNKNISADLAGQFLEQIEQADPLDVFRHLGRNPLYLHLLVHTQPWKGEGVRSLVDVLAEFVRYWLVRDINKGPSRWLFTLPDRLDFLQSFAWHLHKERKALVGFDEFENFVAQYAGGSAQRADIQAISLDFQTTGMFTTTSQAICFTSSGFSDYFVAKSLAECDTNQLPPNVPTPAQARLFACMVECGLAEKWKMRAVSEISRWREVTGRTEVLGLDLDIDHAGLMFGKRASDWKWPLLSSEVYRAAQLVVATALAPAKPNPQNVRLRLANREGLHFRPIMLVESAYSKFIEKYNLPVDTINFRFNDRNASLCSPMELLLLTAPGGCEVELIVKDCSKERVFELLQDMHATPKSKDWSLWESSFFED